MKKKVMMLIVGMFVIVGLPAVALCEEEAAVVIEAAPADTGPPFVETEVYEADMADLQEQIDAIAPIPITQADIPLTISTPGSYYLTEDVNTIGTAITVAVDDVTIDLCGYAVVGPDTGTNTGIYMYGRSNVEIRNGTVRDFSFGIIDGSTLLGYGHRIIDVRVISNTKRGIWLDGKGNLVKDCTVSENGTLSADVYGINAGKGSTVTGNTVRNNGGSAGGYVYGIFAGAGSTVTGNTVSDNGTSATGTLVYGIRAQHSCTVTGNTTRSNGDGARGDVRGISVFPGCTVTGNVACENGKNAENASVYGIYLYGYNLVDQNTAFGNGAEAASAVNMDNTIVTCVYGINVAP